MNDRLWGARVGEQRQSSHAHRTLYVDTHLHTAASYDGHTEPVTLLRRAREVGLDAVVVTDHDTVTGAHRVAELAAEYDLVAVVGCEVSTADGHLLAIGVDSAPEPGRPLPETAREIREESGVAVVPHPFQRSRHGANRTAIRDVDGIEVFNAHTLTNIRNGQAEQFASTNGYPAYGGSDAHRPGGIGHAATAVVLPGTTTVSAGTIVEAMRAGRTAPVSRGAATRQYLSKLLDSATRKMSSLI